MRIFGLNIQLDIRYVKFGRNITGVCGKNIYMDYTVLEYSGEIFTRIFGKGIWQEYPGGVSGKRIITGSFRYRNIW